jgi:hypothetical protein
MPKICWIPCPDPTAKYEVEFLDNGTVKMHTISEKLAGGATTDVFAIRDGVWVHTVISDGIESDGVLPLRKWNRSTKDDPLSLGRDA